MEHVKKISLTQIQSGRTLGEPTLFIMLYLQNLDSAYCLYIVR
jgi:hypothetical protein